MDLRHVGRGRGIVSTEDLEQGDLVLVSKPIAYIASEMGSIPSAEELVQWMQEAAYGPPERKTLLRLYSGEVNDTVPGDGTESDSALDESRLYGIVGCNSFGEEFTDFASFLARTSSSGCPESGGSSPEGALAGGRLAPHGGDVQAGHLGLFPSFSMLNHSCLPNAVNFVVAGRMMVLAARSIPKGGEVLINYLGRASLRPAEERQAALAEAYAFSCDCPRCRAELLAGCAGAGGAEPGYTEGIQDMLARCEQRSELLDSLAAPHAADPGAELPPQEPGSSSGDGGGGSGHGVRGGSSGSRSPTNTEAVRVLEACLAEAAADLERLERLVDGAAAEQAVAATAEPAAGPQQADAAGPEAVRQWLRAAAFDLYGQRTQLADALGRRAEAAGALRQQVGLAAAVAPCSDLHLFLVAKHLGACRAGEGPGSEAAGEAAARCRAVVRGRYGAQLGDETVERLLRGAEQGLAMVQV